MTLNSFRNFRGGNDSTSRQIRDTKLTPGRYIVRIDEVAAEVAKRYGGFVMIKSTVLAHTEDAPAEFIPRKWMVGGPTKPGTPVTYKIWETSPGFGTEIVTLLCNLTGCEEIDVNQEVLERLCSEEQPLRGFVCEVECEHRYRKSELDEQGNPKPGNEGGYTRCYWWRSFGEDDEATVREMVGDAVYDEYVAASTKS